MTAPVEIRVKVDDREARELLATLSGRELKNRMRRGTRAGAKVFREEVRSEARSRSDLPKSFAKTKTVNHSNLSVSTGPTSPLHNIFEGGAGEHAIGSPGQLLHSQQGEPFFAARGPVSHPGMDARPLTGPVFETKKDDAAAAGLEAITEGIRP